MLISIVETKTKKVKLIDFPPTPKVGDIIEIMIVKLPRKPDGDIKDKTAPAWFVKFEESINNRFDNLENRVETGFKQVNDRIDNLVVKNHLKE